MNLSPIGWALRPLQKYAQFSGRASRAEFWWFFLFTLIFYVVVMFVAGTITGTGMMSANPGSAVLTGTVGVSAMIVLLFSLALFIPTLAVQIRRLHDINRSGWWLGVFWLLYIGYMVMAFGTLARASATPDAAPNLGMAAGVGIFALVFFVYSIVLLVFFCLRGTPGPNNYGDDPYGPDVERVFA